MTTSITSGNQLPPTNDPNQIRPPEDNANLQRTGADLGNFLYDIYSLGGRTVSSISNFASAAAAGVAAGAQEVVQRIAFPAISEAAEALQRKTFWTIAQVQKGISNVDVVNMTLKAFNSAMTVFRSIPYAAALDVYRTCQPANEVGRAASKVLNFSGTLKKVTEIKDILRKEGNGNTIGEMPNFLKLISRISLLASDAITHLRTLVDVKLADSAILQREIVRFESYGYKVGMNLDKMQSGISVTGFSFNLADTVRKIVADGRLRLGDALSSSGDVMKIVGVVAGQLAYSGMPVVSAVANIASSLIGITNFYVKDFQLDRQELLVVQ